MASSRHPGNRLYGSLEASYQEDGGDEAEEQQDHHIRTGDVRGGHNTESIQPGRSFTLRAVLAGLVIGILVCLSNVYFGLQTGYSALMSMPSTLLGFVIFKFLAKRLQFPFSPVENVLVQTVAGATGCMPATAGLLSVIPALEYLIGPEDNGPLMLRWSQLLIWSLGLCFFGLVWAMILREQYVVRERLPFPGAKATTALIRVLHSRDNDSRLPLVSYDQASALAAGDHTGVEAGDSGLATAIKTNEGWKDQIKVLLAAGGGSGTFTLLMYFVPMLRDFPIFGSSIAKKWLWTLNLSPGFIGQGIITGPVIPLHMLAGTVVGWAILSPIAKNAGWAPSDVSDWGNGSRSWIMWISLATLLADCLVNLVWQFLRPLCGSEVRLSSPRNRWCRPWQWIFRLFHGCENEYHYSPFPTNSEEDPTLTMGQDELDSRRFATQRRRSQGNESQLSLRGRTNRAPTSLMTGNRGLGVSLLFSVFVATCAVKAVFGDFMPVYAIIIAITLSLPLSVMGIRAIAETDYNPMSGIGKVSQLIFALIIPSSNSHAILINIIAGALAESGASQAADITHDLKVGQLTGASPEAQFYGMIVGSIAGAFISCFFYKLYTSIYPVPGDLFQVPRSYMWVLAAKLVTGQGLPEKAAEFCLSFAILFTLSTAVKIRYADRWWQKFIPSGVAFAVGIYNLPSFTLARAIGGITYWYYCSRRKGDPDRIIVLASGLVLGEGLGSIINLGFAAANVSHLP